jgi:hypothetical protein
VGVGAGRESDHTETVRKEASCNSAAQQAQAGNSYRIESHNVGMGAAVSEARIRGEAVLRSIRIHLW